MRCEVTNIIDSQEYTFYALPATQSLKTLAKISKLIGSTLGAAIPNDDVSVKAITETLLDKNLDISKALQTFSQRLDEDEILKIALLFFAQTSHKGSGRLNSKETVDVHFGGRVLHMIKVFYAALKIEYADFFAGGQGLESIISQAKGSLTPAP